MFVLIEQKYLELQSNTRAMRNLFTLLCSVCVNPGLTLKDIMILLNNLHLYTELDHFKAVILVFNICFASSFSQSRRN